jgi:hypothetical protein
MAIRSINTAVSPTARYLCCFRSRVHIPEHEIFNLFIQRINDIPLSIEALDNIFERLAIRSINTAVSGTARYLCCFRSRVHIPEHEIFNPFIQRINDIPLSIEELDNIFERHPRNERQIGRLFYTVAELNKCITNFLFNKTSCLEIAISSIACAIIPIILSGGTIPIGTAVWIVVAGAIDTAIFKLFAEGVLFGTTVIIKSLYHRSNHTIIEKAKINTSIDIIRSNFLFKFIRSIINTGFVCAAILHFPSATLCYNSLLQIGVIGIGSLLLKTRKMVSDRMLRLYDMNWRIERRRLDQHENESISQTIIRNGNEYLASLEGRVPEADDDYTHFVQLHNNERFTAARHGDTKEDINIIKEALKKYRTRARGTEELKQFEKDFESFSGNSLSTIARESIIEIFSAFKNDEVQSRRLTYPRIIKPDCAQALLRLHKDFASLTDLGRTEVVTKLHGETSPKTPKEKKVWEEIRKFSSLYLLQGNVLFNTVLQKALSNQ